MADFKMYSPAFETALNISFITGTGAPTGVSANKGSIYINLTATTSTTRLYLNSDGGTTWVSFTASA
jgi:hypothetical protein